MDQNIPTPSDCVAATHPPMPKQSDDAAYASMVDMLHDLAVLGMDFCRDIHAHREKPTQPGTTTTRQEAADARATAQVFGGLARTVRHTLFLESSLREARRRRAAAAEAAAQAATKTRIEDGKRELRHRMQPVLQAAPAKTHTDIRYQINTSLNDWEAEQDIAHRSVGHAIARICRNFNVPPPRHQPP